MTESLAIPERKGFHRHWFNGFGNRIEVALVVGWRHVEDETGQHVVRCVGQSKRKGALYATLMEIESQRYAALASEGGVLGAQTNAVETGIEGLDRMGRAPGDPGYGLPEGERIVAIAQGAGGQVIVATTTMVWRLVDDHLEPIEFRPAPD
jgi:hypothetical protein